MCHFDPVVSLSVEPGNQAFDWLWDVSLLFSGVILSMRSFFTILVSNFEIGHIFRIFHRETTTFTQFAYSFYCCRTITFAVQE